MIIKLRDLNNKFTSIIKQAVDETSDTIISNIKDVTPVDTGELRDSIIKDNQDDKIVIKIDENSPASDYAEFVNYGTSKVAGKYFIEIGYRKSKPVETLIKNIKEGLK